MKKKRRKLKLNRQTVRNLNAGQLRFVAGGDSDVSEIPWQCETLPTGPETICDDTTCEGSALGCETGAVACASVTC